MSDERAATEIDLTERDREHLVKADEAAHRDFDRIVTTLSSGALAISLVFVHDVAPHPKHIVFVAMAWCLFAVSLLVNLFSYLTSIEGLRAEINRLDGTPVRGWLATQEGLTGKLNWVSALAFFFGVASLVMFASTNV